MKKFSKRSITIEMDRAVRQMLKLIEEDGESFAQKAEMYYQKRPELISLVEEFYRGYRFLAERYEHVTGELGKNMPSDLQSQASGISDNGSDPPSTWPSPSPRKLGRRISSNRAAGFDFFLGSGGNNNGYDAPLKDGDASSTLTDSDEEFDDASSFNSCSGFFANASDQSMNRRVMELEIELREMKEKLCSHEEERVEGSYRGGRIENAENHVRAKINAYEQELRYVNEKLRLSEKEIGNLKAELEKCRAMESDQFHAAGAELSSPEEFEMELRFAKEKLESSEMEIASLKFEASKSCESIQQLQYQVNLAQKESTTWRTKFNSERRENNKLQERLARLKTSLAERDHEIRDLKGALSDAEVKIFFQKAQVKSEMSKLMGEQTHMEEKIREWEIHCQSLEENIRKVLSEKIEMEETLKGEIEQLKEDNNNYMKNSIKDLNGSIDALKLERDDLNAEIGSLKEVLNSKDNHIEQMDINLQQLNMEHVQLIAGMEEAQRQVRELKTSSKELEEEIERQRVEILQGAEEKREAIRQLCFSLEHYRNGYNKLRQAFMGHKRFPVLAT